MNIMNKHSVRRWRHATIATILPLDWAARGPPSVPESAAMNKIRNAKYQIGQVVRHRLFPFRGVVFDIDPIFSNTEEWYEAIPAEVRPHKDQPFYHLFAENDETEYIAYVSEQNLLPDLSGEPVRHPQVAEIFVHEGKGRYRPRSTLRH
jgi:heat shock protein HspQ